MQITLYFHNENWKVLDAVKEEKLRVEIIGDPNNVEKIKQVIRKEVKKWEGWVEA
ncbi:MAG: hypothetical protein ACTSVA_00915 [Candidatus Njordarchaeales archaeon]